MKKKIALLGSTGSIGIQTLEVIKEFIDEFEIVLLSGHSNIDLLLEQVIFFRPEVVVTTDNEKYTYFRDKMSGKTTRINFGTDGLINELENTEIDLVVAAISGAAGIKPTIKALELGIDVALANKETIVAAGSIVCGLQEKTGAKIIPVDSEHSAIMQCLEPDRHPLQKLLLTASGGPFRGYTRQELENVSPERALKHPNWQMGKKITIDSATLMNKGLEVIEAHWLFQVDYDKIEVVIHPQSIVHSMVQYGDGTILGHLGLPDMKVPIQYALTYPRRRINSFPKLDILNISKLEFMKPDYANFPCLSLAYEAGKTGGTMPVVLNASNEIAVEFFLNKKISFNEIPKVIQQVMDKHIPLNVFELEEIIEIDKWARFESTKYIPLR
ncbi:MAG: 1-deoxy-D-xylulose-5-phosphate reductoisomerase [Bacillota bacterium]